MNSNRSENTQKKALITGGAGFIGRALIEECLRSGWQVAIYDNFTTGRTSNIDQFASEITVFENDIRHSASISAALAEFQPTCVFHLAAIHYIPYCNSHPVDTVDINVTGTYSVLDACVQHEVKRFVLASSGVLYASVSHPLDEETDKPTAGDVYGLSKLMAEQICHFFASIHAIDCRIARIFNTYGPFETNPHILPDIMQQLHVTPEKLELGNLEPKRDYIFVKDTAAALFALAQFERNDYSIFNVGTGKEYSVRDLVSSISRLLGNEITIVQAAGRMRPSDKLHQMAKIDRLMQVAGFHPTYNLHTGLAELLTAEGFQLTDAI